MKTTNRFDQAAAVMAALFFAASNLHGAGQTAPAPEEGVALVIVYDTSGSMREAVRDSNGQQTPKYRIANQALTAIVTRLENFVNAAPAGAPRKVKAGLVIFGEGQGVFAVPFGPFNAKAMRDWATRFGGPNGNTPLGNSLRLAGDTVLKSSLTRKHVLVITDGMNTSGPNPAAVMPQLKMAAEKKQTGLNVHFVAFDVAASVFEPLKRLGATVVSAADEPQLNAQLGFILEKKILLEDEEPPAKSGKK